MKTPVTSLMGAAQVLRAEWDRLAPADRDQLLDLVIRAARDLAGRVSGLLVEARAEVQSRELVPVEIDLTEFLSIATRAFGAVADGHHVRAEVDQGLTAVLDPVALQQVLGHLIDNAVKYSPAGGRVTVTGHRSGDGVTLAVADEGDGMPEGIDVFEPFARGNNAQVGIVPGIGLGLHIVRNLVEAMGGAVAITSTAGRGSTVTVTLPAEPRRSSVDIQQPDP